MNEQIIWSPGVSLEEIEKQVILKALRFYRGVKTTTANALGISVRTLDNKLEQYNADTAKNAEAQAEEKARREEFQRRSRGIACAQPNGILPPKAEARPHVEPAQVTAQELAMPMPIGKEVQSMPPKRAAGGGSRRSRA